jgi:hypothetical protein
MVSGNIQLRLPWDITIMIAYNEESSLRYSSHDRGRSKGSAPRTGRSMTGIAQQLSMGACAEGSGFHPLECWPLNLVFRDFPF